MARRVGFIGLGTMGRPMASNLLAAGFPLTVHDIDPRAQAALAAQGAATADSPRAVAAASEVVVTMLPSSPHVEAVYGGEEGVLAGLAPGGTCIDMSTIDPLVSRRLAEQAAARGIRFLDAPVSGSSERAWDGTLTIMVGGESAVVEECRPILAAMGRHIIHVGPAGMGEVVKLANNLAAAINMVGVAEAFLFGLRNGADPRLLFEVMQNSSGASWALSNRVPVPGVLPEAPSSHQFAPGFMTDLMHKDLGLVLDAARQLRLPLAMTALAQQLYAAASALGHGREDFSAVYAALCTLANRPLEGGEG